jgi:hypothetical protein
VLEGSGGVGESETPSSAAHRRSASICGGGGGGGGENPALGLTRALAWSYLGCVENISPSAHRKLFLDSNITVTPLVEVSTNEKLRFLNFIQTLFKTLNRQ